jgi:SulP family sulfate permease
MTQQSPDVDVVILRMGRVPYIDQSGLYAIEDAIMALHDKTILVLITEIQEQPADMLRGVGLIPEMIPEERLYVNLASAINALKTGEAFKEVPKKDTFSWSFVKY